MGEVFNTGLNKIFVEDIEYILNETNTDVHMYTEEFILDDVVTLLYRIISDLQLKIHSYLYKRNNG